MSLLTRGSHVPLDLIFPWIFPFPNPPPPFFFSVRTCICECDAADPPVSPALKACPCFRVYIRNIDGLRSLYLLAYGCVPREWIGTYAHSIMLRTSYCSLGRAATTKRERGPCAKLFQLFSLSALQLSTLCSIFDVNCHHIRGRSYLGPANDSGLFLPRSQQLGCHSPRWRASPALHHTT